MMKAAKQKELLIRAYTSLNAKEWNGFKVKTTDMIDKNVKMLELPQQIHMVECPICHCVMKHDLSTGSIYKGGTPFIHTKGSIPGINLAVGHFALANTTTGIDNAALGRSLQKKRVCV